MSSSGKVRKPSWIWAWWPSFQHRSATRYIHTLNIVGRISFELLCTCHFHKNHGGHLGFGHGDLVLNSNLLHLKSTPTYQIRTPCWKHNYLNNDSSNLFQYVVMFSRRHCQKSNIKMLGLIDFKMIHVNNVNITCKWQIHDWVWCCVFKSHTDKKIFLHKLDQIDERAITHVDLAIVKSHSRSNSRFPSNSTPQSIVKRQEKHR
jgi:hypothetical protein